MTQPDELRERKKATAQNLQRLFGMSRAEARRHVYGETLKDATKRQTRRAQLAQRPGERRAARDRLVVQDRIGLLRALGALQANVEDKET